MKKQKNTEYTIVWIDNSGMEHSDRHDKGGLIKWMKKYLTRKISTIKWNDQVIY